MVQTVLALDVRRIEAWGTLSHPNLQTRDSDCQTPGGNGPDGDGEREPVVEFRRQLPCPVLSVCERAVLLKKQASDMAEAKR